MQDPAGFAERVRETAAPASQRAVPAERSSFWIWAGIALLMVITLAGTIVANGHPAVALAPIVLFGVVYALLKAPLRLPAAFMLWGGLVLDSQAQELVNGAYKSPLYILGQLLLIKLNSTIPIGPLVVSGVDLLVFFGFALYGYRRITGSRIDRIGVVDMPRPLIAAAFIALAGVAMVWAMGLARGGSFRFSLWQVQRCIYVPLVFLYFSIAFPQAREHRWLVKFILGCALFKALLSIGLRFVFKDADYTTSHADSQLFATATCGLVIWFYEKQDQKTLLRMLPMLGLLVWGMIANDRRLVWVEIGIALLFVFFMTRWTRLKVKIVRYVLMSLPVIAVYVAAGWNHPSGPFAPVATLRSMVDSDSDGSTQWRDLENFNLVSTLSARPVLGTGWGHPFDMAVPMPDITEFYELEPYAPHNSFLGVWAYTGVVGFTMIFLPVVVGAYFAARVYRHAKSPTDRVTAMTAFCCFVIYLNHAYGDLGLGTWTSVFLLAPCLVCVGRLAVVVGAWPKTMPRRSRGRTPRITIRESPSRPVQPRPRALPEKSSA